MGKPEKNVVCEIKCTRENNCYDSKCLQSKKRKTQYKTSTKVLESCRRDGQVGMK